MADRKYRIVESVGRRLEDVHDYESLEKHHPTWKEDHAKRKYASIAGEREEFVRSPSGERMVSKDFVLLSQGSAAVPVPSPVEGYIRRSERLDRWGTVRIYDGPGQDASLIAQIRHMDPIRVSHGEYVQFGQPLGQQGRKSPPGISVGLHTHMDIAESRLEDFRRYIRDIDSAAITPDYYSGRVHSDVAVARQQSQGTNQAIQNLEQKSKRGGLVRSLQEQLAGLGYVDANGRSLRVDGEFGANTAHAVRTFQQAHGLQVDGIVGNDTKRSLLEALRAPLISERTHPDNRLFEEARKGLAELPKGTFRGTELDRAAAALASTVRQAGFARIDHVVMSSRGDGVIAVQGDPQHPGRNVVSIDKAAATSQSIEQSTRQLADSSVRQSDQVQVRMEHMEHRAGLSMGVRP